jgi:hypothetical protein
MIFIMPLPTLSDLERLILETKDAREHFYRKCTELRQAVQAVQQAEPVTLRPKPDRRKRPHAEA